MQEKTFTKKDWNFIVAMSMALGLRQFALIMVMPFIAIYSNQLGGTPALAGIAVGIFGLVQGSLQIPYGSLSDTIGRKRSILFGLSLLVIGLFLAGIATNVYVLILARAIQGCGAINAVAYAWISDNTSNENRNKAMNVAGIFVGVCVIAGFLAGPTLCAFLKYSQIFIICAVVTIILWVYILIFIKEDKFKKAEKQGFVGKIVLKDKNILLLSSAAFTMNFVFISMFYIVPQVVEAGQGVNGLWKVFVPGTIAGILTVKLTSKPTNKGYFKLLAMISFAAFMLGGLLYYPRNFILIILGMIVSMSGYMYLSVTLPSYLTKIAQKNYIGSITGVFNTFQFIGSFFGGAVTGILWGINKDLALTVVIISCIAGIASIKCLKLKVK